MAARKGNFKFPRRYRPRIRQAYRFGSTEAGGHWELDNAIFCFGGRAGLCLLAMNAAVGVSPALAVGASDAKAPIVPAQNEPKKNETVQQKVKRVWRNLTGYKFEVGCPAILELTKKTCTETGKDHDAARPKRISANPFCSVSDMK